MTPIGSTATFLTLTPGPGVWRLTPSAYAAPQTPWAAKVQPFVLKDAAQFLPGPPPSLSSSDWATAFNELKTYGSATSTARTADAVLSLARQQPPTCVIVDLSNPGLQIAELLSGLDALPNRPRVVATPERFLGVMGMPINAAGDIEAENLTLACRNAVLNMIDLLQERGFSREQAYVICSVAVDLRVSNVVDVPNYVVSALLPEAIFDGD